jgi:hypothetical protein
MKSFFREKGQRKVVFSLIGVSGVLKMFFVLSLLFSLLLIPISGSAQRAKITYTASNTALSKVFDDLSRKYLIKFAYDAEVFRKINASVSFRNEPFKKITEYLGNKYSLEFILMEGTWISKR